MTPTSLDPRLAERMAQLFAAALNEWLADDNLQAEWPLDCEYAEAETGADGRLDLDSPLDPTNNGLLWHLEQRGQEPFYVEGHLLERVPSGPLCAGPWVVRDRKETALRLALAADKNHAASQDVRDRASQSRALAIKGALDAGASMQEVADKLNLSKQRVSAIVAGLKEVA